MPYNDWDFSKNYGWAPTKVAEAIHAAVNEERKRFRKMIVEVRNMLLPDTRYGH